MLVVFRGSLSKGLCVFEVVLIILCMGLVCRCMCGEMGIGCHDYGMSVCVGGRVMVVMLYMSGVSGCHGYEI